MFDAQLNKILKPILDIFAKKLSSINVNPNTITFIGFLFGICCFYSIAKGMFINACIFLFLNRLCDALDGALARYLNSESILGAYLDAVADKLMVNTAFFILCYANILPYYILVIALTRDLIILVGIIIRQKNNNYLELKPIFLSKINTFMQIVLVTFCLLFLNNIVNLTYIQDIINAVALTTIFSTLEYIYKYKKYIVFKNTKLVDNI